MSASTVSTLNQRSPKAEAWPDGKRYLWPLALVVPILLSAPISYIRWNLRV